MICQSGASRGQVSQELVDDKVSQKQLDNKILVFYFVHSQLNIRKNDYYFLGIYNINKIHPKLQAHGISCYRVMAFLSFSLETIFGLTSHALIGHNFYGLLRYPANFNAKFVLVPKN